MEDPRRYMRAMTYIRDRIENGTYKPGELMPHINTLAQQTGHSRHTISKARAPRGALLYRPRSGHRLEEVSVGLMAYLDP
jgi:DNA-binding transcriptional MocR family regulator